MAIPGINENTSSLCQNYSPTNDLFYEMLIPSAKLRVMQDPNNFLTLTIHDVKPNCLDQYCRYLEINKTDSIFQNIKEVLVMVHKNKSNNKEKDEFEKSEKNALFFKDIKDQSNKLVKLAVAQFKTGAPLSVLINVDASKVIPNLSLCGTEQRRSDIPQLVYSLEEMKNATLTEKILLEQAVHNSLYSPSEEKKLTKQISQLSKLAKKAQESKKQENDKRVVEHVQFHHYYLFLSAKLNKDLDKVTVEELNSLSNQKNYEEFKEKKRLQLERQREIEIEKSFLSSESVKKSPPKPKGKKQKNKRLSVAKKEKASPEKSLSSPEKEISSPLSVPFFCGENQFVLDKRITRWFGATTTEIKQFTDKVLLTTVRHYVLSTPLELEEQSLYHSLLGVHRLMSLTQANLQKYSTSYEFMHNGSLKSGRCFSAELKHGNIKEEGMIYIGVDGNRIYHAKFVSFVKKFASTDAKPKDFCLSLDGLESLPNLSEEVEWELKGGYTFEILEDTIVWTIGKGKDLVKYEIHSLF